MIFTRKNHLDVILGILITDEYVNNIFNQIK